MELIVIVLIAVVGGAVLALTLFSILWKIVAPAVENLLDWLIHTFGNENAAREVEEKWRGKGQ